MFSKTLFALLAALAINAQTISTPAAVIQCQPARFAVSGGTAPYIVDVIPGGQVSAAAIAFIGNDIQGPAFTWTPNLAAGSNITFRITDSTGSVQYSSPTVVQAGSDSSCLNASASSVATGAITTTGDSSSTASDLPSQTASSGSASASTTSSAASSSGGVASSASQSASSVRSAASSAASGASNSVSSVASAASSAVASVTSAANGATKTGVAGAGAIAAGVIGGIAMLF